MTTRMLLRGGMVADGIGATTLRADVLIEDGVIASVGIGDVSDFLSDCDVIDLAAGSVVCPGFIDAHVHAEGATAGKRAGGRGARPGSDHACRRPGRGIVDRSDRGNRPIPQWVLRAGQRCAGADPPVERTWIPRGRLGKAAAERRCTGVTGNDPAQRGRADGWTARDLQSWLRPGGRWRPRWPTAPRDYPAGWTTCPAGSVQSRK